MQFQSKNWSNINRVVVPSVGICEPIKKEHIFLFMIWVFMNPGNIFEVLVDVSLFLVVFSIP